MNLPKHMPALDGLRGVAILMVLLTHVGSGWVGALSIYPGDYATAPSFDVPPWMGAIAHHAAFGVELFFVVSAFTLTIRVSQGDGNLGNYALRRIARVGPGYWIAAVVYTLIGGMAPRLWAPDGISILDVIIAIAFGSAWTGGASLAVVPGGWSVVCEMAFYICLPLLIKVIAGRLWRSIVLTILVWGLAQLLARQAMVHGSYNFQFNVNPIEQAPVFLCGVTAALTAMRFRLPHLPGASLALMIVAVALLPFQPIRHWFLVPHVLFAVVVAVAVALAAAYPPAILANRVMRRLGEVSYSIYLVHFAVLAISLRVIERLVPTLSGLAMLLHFMLTLAISYAIASMTYRYIEQPAIRWAGRRSRTLPVPTLLST